MAGGRGGCKEGWRKQLLRPLFAPSTEAAVRHRTAMAGTTARPSYMLIHGFCQVDALPRWKFALCQAFEPEDERCQELCEMEDRCMRRQLAPVPSRRCLSNHITAAQPSTRRHASSLPFNYMGKNSRHNTMQFICGRP